MRRVLIIAATALTSAIAGCGDPPHGSIVELSYTPAHRANVSVDDYSLICTPDGSGGISCASMYVGSHLEERAFEAQWNVTLTHCGHDAKCHDAIVAISRDQYETWAIGDYYPAVLTSPGIRSLAR